MAIEDQDWEGGLYQAFGPPEEGESVLDQIQRLHGAGSSLLLRETDADVAPVLIQRSDGGAAHDDSRYQILGEIARGGIGVVYRGRDKDLNRDVALKVLRPEFADRADVVQRFVEEAQVGGQLQHPGIVPIYGFGLQDDGRPCFAMRLIKGETLAELLDDNPKGIDLLAVFEQVIQTMAYAHSRGVIHRDLKPANVMIGAFGEVQVVDWGFAKVLGQEELTPRPAEQTVIATVRSEGEGSQSMAGSVMGTPAYMPPEQAMGQIDELDERADVFALGAILCEVLTGKPPYTGEPRDVLVAATQSRLDEAYERIDACDAAGGLKQLVRDCLEPISAKRPKNAARVAERFRDHLAGVEEEARQAQLDALASEEEAARQRHGRRRTLVLAGLVLFAIFVAGGSYATWKGKRDAREERAAPMIASALREATTFEGGENWAAAAAAAKRAVDIAASEGVDDAGARAMLAEFEKKSDAAAAERVLAEADERFMAEIEEAWAQGADHYQYEEIDAAFVAAVERRFPDMEIDIERFKASPHGPMLAAILDGWARYRRTEWALEDKDWKTVDATARAIDPKHNHLRDAMLADDPDTLEDLVETLDLTTLSTGMIYNLGRTLWGADRFESAIALMKRALLLHPDEFWFHWRLASSARKAKKHDIALQHYAAAVALRPHSREVGHYYGIALHAAGDYEGALDAWRHAYERNPGWVHGLVRITDALDAQGRSAEAVALFREAIARNPNEYSLFNKLGQLYRDKLHDTENAIATYREGAKLMPNDGRPFSSIGRALNRAGRFDEAIEELEKAITLSPEYGAAYLNLATAWVGNGDVERAIDVLDKAPFDEELESKRWTYYIGLAGRLSENGKWDAAIRMARRAQELAPDEMVPCAHVAGYYFHKGTTSYPNGMEAFDEAIAWYFAAIERAPPDAPHYARYCATYYASLGNAYSWKGDRDASMGAIQKALELDPKNRLAQQLLGNELRMKGDWKRAVAELREALERDPRNRDARWMLASTLGNNGAPDESVRVLREGIKLTPRDPQARLNLCWGLAHLWRIEDAIAEFEQAIEVHPKNANVRLGFGSYLADWLRRWDDAADQYRSALEISPRNPSTHYALGNCLRTIDSDAAIRHYKRAIELHGKAPMSHCNLGMHLRSLGRWSEAVEFIRRGHENGTARGSWPFPSESWLRTTEQVIALKPTFERVVAGETVDVTTDERVLLAEMLRVKGHHALSAEFYVQAFREDPSLKEIGKGHRNGLLLAAVEAGERYHPHARALLREYIEIRRADLNQMEAGGAVMDVASWRGSQFPTLAPVRDGAGVPDKWKQVWAELDALYTDAMEVLRK